MRKIENEIKEMFRRARLGFRAEGQVKCSMSDGSVGRTGRIYSGLFWKTERNLNEILNSMDLEHEGNFGSKLFELWEASKKEKKGPIYGCNINIKGKKIDMEYFWEGDDFKSLSEIEPDIHGACHLLSVRGCSRKS